MMRRLGAAGEADSISRLHQFILRVAGFWSIRPINFMFLSPWPPLTHNPLGVVIHTQGHRLCQNEIHLVCYIWLT